MMSPRTIYRRAVVLSGSCDGNRGWEGNDHVGMGGDDWFIIYGGSGLFIPTVFGYCIGLCCTPIKRPKRSSKRESLPRIRVL